MILSSIYDTENNANAKKSKAKKKLIKKDAWTREELVLRPVI